MSTVAWTEVASDAPFGARVGLGGVVLSSGVMLVLGGSATDSVSDVGSQEVWTSEGGAAWTQVAVESVMWSGRKWASVAGTPDGRVVVVGGLGTVVLGDVWISDDGGVTWEAQPTFGGGARYKATAVALPNGDVIVAGGLDAADSALRDVWISYTGGTSWRAAAPQTSWGPRHSHSMTALPDGDVLLLAGITKDEGFMRDVYVSHDNGASWAVVITTAPFSARAGAACAADSRGSVVVVGGYSTQYLADAWVSHDKGKSWTPLAGAPTAFEARAWAVALASPRALAVVAGGKHPGTAAHSSGLSDVWALVPGAWETASCSSAKRALCSASPGPTTVTVELPASAGEVSPPNAPSAAAFQVVYAPPQPVMSVPSGEQASTMLPAIPFDIDFTSPVTGLKASHFVVDAAAGLVMGRTLQGGGTSWRLVVEAAVGSQLACPTGYTAVALPSGDVVCGRAVESHGTWDQQASACAPYGLASVHSREELVAFASIRGSDVADYWYAWSRCSVTACWR